MDFLTGLLMCIPLYAAFRAFAITRNPEAKKRIPKTTLKALTFFAYFIFIVLGFFIITEAIEYLSQL